MTSGFGDLELMQELTSVECYKASVGQTGQLKDMRDEKLYWVAKLKDGNCWMVQNLDYDDPGSTKIANPSNWTSTLNNYRAYYDPGEKIVNGTSLANATTSTDRHLLVGNYYSWESATNASATSITSGNATGSICPSGWQLPSSNSDTASGSFGKLLSGLGTGSTWSSAIRTAPYYFQYGGTVNSGNLYFAGSEGYYWSSTASTASNAYNLYFTSSSVYPSSSNNRYLGFSVRCLVNSN